MPFQPSIATRPPFNRQPLRWASPPGAGDVGAIPGPATLQPGGLSVGSLSSVTFATRLTGVQGVAWPTLVRVATQGFAQPVALLGVSLCASISNTSLTNTSTLAVHKDVGASLNVSAGTDFLAEYTVEQGLAHSIRSGTSFSDNLAPYFGTNEAVAIYALMQDAGCAFTAIVSVRYVILP